LSLANTKWHGVAIEKQAAYWCEMVNAGIESGRKLGEDLYIEIKYEDLVLKSEETLKKICKFLAEEYDRCILEYYQSADFSVVSGSTHPVVSHPAHNMGGCSGNESPRTDRGSDV